MKRIFGFSLASILMSTTALALPIEEAVRTALQTNPDVGIVIENRRAIEYELQQSEARYQPSVDFNAGVGHEYTDDPGSRNSGDSYYSMNRYESGLTVTQMLFDGYATDSDVARQESRVVSATRRVRETSEQIGLDAVQAYLEARRQRELTELSEDNVRIHEETLDLVTRKVNGGAATVADQQQAASRLAAAQAGLEDARVRLRDADATYVRIIGESPAALERPVAPFWAMPNNLDEAIDWAIDNNPTVNVAKADLETTVREFDGAKSDHFPTVNLELGADANRNVDGTRGAEYSAEAMVRMTYNLYRGGEDTYRRQEFLARIAESRQVYNREVRLTEEAMRLAWNARDGSVSRVRAQRREVEANDVVRQTYRQQFDLGGRNLLELLDSENEYFLARTNMISTEFQAIYGVYRVLATGGVLLASLEVPNPIEANSGLDPVAHREVDLEAKDAQSINIDPVLGDDLGALDAPEIDPSDLEGLEGETLDPSELELDPNALDLGEEPVTLDPTSDASEEVTPVSERLEAEALDVSGTELSLDAEIADAEMLEIPESVASTLVSEPAEALSINADSAVIAPEVVQVGADLEVPQALAAVEASVTNVVADEPMIPVMEYAAFDDLSAASQAVGFDDVGFVPKYGSEETAF